MKSVLDYFKIISAIPRCSYDTKKMKEFIEDFAQDFGFKVKVDKAGNILCKIGDPKVCLQSHYDMVCLGDAPKVELEQIGNLLKAKNSTLGADNGMGIAVMLYCMQKYDNLECLFTADEEVGLIGATNLELEITSANILNLDGEDEKDIYIGCAGGADVISSIIIEYCSIGNSEKIYKATVKNLPGGHSGADIDKNIPSSIKVISKFLVENACELISINGGERRNSIAKNATAIFTCNEVIKNKDEHIDVEEIKNTGQKKIKNSQKIIKTLDAFSQGVRSWNKEFNIPQDSANLGIVEIDNNEFKIIISLRSMSDENMNNLIRETKSFFDVCGFTVSFSSKHNAWTPNAGEFSNSVKKIMSKYLPNVQFKSIHAGLECGVLISNQERPKEAVSIGPTIRFPHSIREECELESVERISQVVEEIILL